MKLDQRENRQRCEQDAAGHNAAPSTRRLHDERRRASRFPTPRQITTRSRRPAIATACRRPRSRGRSTRRRDRAATCRRCEGPSANVSATTNGAPMTASITAAGRDVNGVAPSSAEAIWPIITATPPPAASSEHELVQPTSDHAGAHKLDDRQRARLEPRGHAIARARPDGARSGDRRPTHRPASPPIGRARRNRRRQSQTPTAVARIPVRAASM